MNAAKWLSCAVLSASLLYAVDDAALANVGCPSPTAAWPRAADAESAHGARQTDALAAAERRAPCDAIAWRLVDGDSLIVRRIGERLAFNLADTPEAKALAIAARRQSNWMMSRLADGSFAVDGVDAQYRLALEIVERYRRAGSELNGAIALAESSREGTMPPPDYVGNPFYELRAK